MAASDAERALDRFYRAADSDADGFGLGLSIVREVVGVMGGTLSIDSRPEEGTTVSIVLASRDDVGARRMSGRVLLVDDERDIVDPVTYALEQEGFEVRSAGDGVTALELARGERYDVVVLDIVLPGMSGIDVCRTLRGESDVPIVMLTARDGEVDRVLGLELGADDYVTKPFSTAELISRIRAILRRRELDRDARAGSELRVGGIVIDLARHTRQRRRATRSA